MTPIERRRIECDELLSKRRQMILERALTEFCNDGIENTTMADVAKASKVGVATLYRYFCTKSELVIQCAVLFWKKEEENFTPSLMTSQYQAMSGIQQLEIILNLTVKIFKEYRDFFKFISEFDAYVRKEIIGPTRLSDYEKEIIRLRPFIVNALEKGMADHTIHLKYTIDETYLTLTHLLLSLAQKFAIYGDILATDKMVEQERQIQIAADLLIDALKA